MRTIQGKAPSTPRTNVLDLILKPFVYSTAFHETKDKNWEAISRMVPGTTAKQCQRRYEELLVEKINEEDFPEVTGSSFKALSLTGLSNKSEYDKTEQKSGRPASAKRQIKPERESQMTKAVARSNSEDNGLPYIRYLKDKPNPIMVIHVCDEAKNLKQDFNCPRDLLVAEMKYFAEYLSTDASRWEEVDISVHCDVQIFDWLMKYVKKTLKDSPSPPRLEPTNVISILISSDFLKMDNLVQECIEFCHDNMTAIVATPCNMNCISDKLVTRIADLFTHNEADDVRDRKDKFKSKLFAKKVERLFDPSLANPDAPENASSLYRCGICKRLLSQTLESKLKCAESRMLVNKHGGLIFSHVRDPTWDVNEFLVDLKAQLKTWQEVYWRVWGLVNYLQCARCEETFPCAELGHCKFHSEAPIFDSVMSEKTVSPMGIYPCCNTKTLRFDPTQSNQGCRVRDHVVNLINGPSEAGEGPSRHSATSKAQNKVYDDLLSHRDSICMPYQKLTQSTTNEKETDVFKREEGPSVQPVTGPTISKAKAVAQNAEDKGESKPRLQALTFEREVVDDDEIGMGESDDEVGDEEDFKIKKSRPRRSRVTVDPRAILLDAPDFSTIRQRKWDSTRSLRWNQDAQREEDRRRMNDIVQYLIKLRLPSDKIEKLKQREFAGGIYCKLEAQWKLVNMPPPKLNQPAFRGNKTRLTQVKLN